MDNQTQPPYAFQNTALYVDGRREQYNAGSGDVDKDSYVLQRGILVATVLVWPTRGGRRPMHRSVYRWVFRHHMQGTSIKQVDRQHQPR